jgi:hypothetical protein
MQFNNKNPSMRMKGKKFLKEILFATQGFGRLEDKTFHRAKAEKEETFPPLEAKTFNKFLPIPRLS